MANEPCRTQGLVPDVKAPIQPAQDIPAAQLAGGVTPVLVSIPNITSVGGVPKKVVHCKVKASVALAGLASPAISAPPIATRATSFFIVLSLSLILTGLPDLKS
jgi:hypothetical protein